MQTKAIIIKKENTNEYDQWITCYTEEFGKLKAVAKSILKPSSIQALHLDVFNLAEFELINGRGMPIIAGAQVINSFGGIKGSLSKTAVAYFFAEALDKMVFENDKDCELWEFLVLFLNKLNVPDHNPNLQMVSDFVETTSEYLESQEVDFDSISLLREGQARLLDVLGYLPEMDNCKSCDDKLGEGNLGAFNHALGGVVCKRCFLSGHGGILISQEDFHLMQSTTSKLPEARLLEQKPGFHRSVLDGMFEYISGDKFSSLELLNMIR